MATPWPDGSASVVGGRTYREVMPSSFRNADLDHCALIAADSAALADAAAGNLDAKVENCPEWTVADLVRHVCDVHAFWGQIVERRLADPDDVRVPR